MDVVNEIEVTVTDGFLSVIQEASKQPLIFYPACEYDRDPQGYTKTEAVSCAED